MLASCVPGDNFNLAAGIEGGATVGTMGAAQPREADAGATIALSTVLLLLTCRSEVGPETLQSKELPGDAAAGLS